MTTVVGPTAPIPYRPRGSVGARLDRGKILLAGGIGLAVVVGAANVVLFVNRQRPTQPVCSLGKPCVPAPPSGPLLLGQRWVSTDLGYSFEHDPQLAVTSQDGRSVTLQGSTSDASIEINVSGTSAADASPEQLAESERAAWSRSLLGLVADNSSPDQIVAPGLGFVRGAGGGYVGTVDAPSGPSKSANVAIMAAGDGRVSAVLSVLIVGEGLSATTISDLRGMATDEIYDTFRWR